MLGEYLKGLVASALFHCGLFSRVPSVIDGDEAWTYRIHGPLLHRISVVGATLGAYGSAYSMGHDAPWRAGMGAILFVASLCAHGEYHTARAIAYCQAEIDEWDAACERAEGSANEQTEAQS